MSISQEFIALWERVRKASELIKRAFFGVESLYVYMCFFLNIFFFFGLPHKDLWVSFFIVRFSLSHSFFRSSFYRCSILFWIYSAVKVFAFTETII